MKKLTDLISLVNNRRVNFLLCSTAVAAFLFSSHWFPAQAQAKLTYLIISVLLTLVFTFWVLGMKKPSKDWLFFSVLPAHFALGAALSFLGFPNLSMLFRVAITGVLVVLYYACLLVLNIFVVVREKGKAIPLYRVAVIWTQILIIVVAVPMYSGIFKLDINPALETLSVAVSSFFLTLFYLWALALEEEKTNFSLAFLASFWILLLAISISFLPFEAFFRALFLSSILLFGIGYVHNIVKHTLTQRILNEYILITLAFLFLGLLFVP